MAAEILTAEKLQRIYEFLGEFHTALDNQLYKSYTLPELTEKLSEIDNLRDDISEVMDGA